MDAYLLESLVVLFVAGLLGCLLGCLARHACARLAAFQARKVMAMAPVTEPAERKVAALIHSGRKMEELPPAALLKPRDGGKDDLCKIKGVNEAIEKKLNGYGVHHFDQIGDFTRANVRWLDREMKLKGRIDREEWVYQARRLAMVTRRAPYKTSPMKKSKSDFMPPDIARRARASRGAAPAMNQSGSEAADRQPSTDALVDRLNGPRHGKADDLKQIKGIGPKIEEMLNELGIYHYDQIARWTKGQVAEIDERLKFKGRVGREKWIKQARALNIEATSKPQEFSGWDS